MTPAEVLDYQKRREEQLQELEVKKMRTKCILNQQVNILLFNPFLHIFSFQHIEEKNLQESIVVKGEIAQNEQFHLFPQCFLCNLYLKIL